MRLITELLALSLVEGCPSSTDSDQARYPQPPPPQPEYTYQAPQQQQQQQPTVQSHHLGIAVQPMTGELRTYFGMADNQALTVDIQVIRQGQVVALQANLAMPEQQANQML